MFYDQKKKKTTKVSLEKRNMKEKRDLTSLIKKKHTHTVALTSLHHLPFLQFVSHAANRMFIHFVSQGDKKEMGEMHGECI